MAGAPGKSGGKRAGAGRKPAPKLPPVPVDVPEDKRDTLKLLQDIAFGIIDATPIQVRAAVAAVQYTHTKRHDGGKRDEQQDAAKKAASGRFSASAAPLKLVGRK